MATVPLVPSTLRPLTEYELAARWRVPVSTVRNLRLRGKGPAYIKVGAVTRYAWPAILRWERQPRPAKSAPTNCAACNGHGLFAPMDLGCCTPPDGYVFVERCDTCRRYFSDGTAARSIDPRFRLVECGRGLRKHAVVPSACNIALPEVSR